MLYTYICILFEKQAFTGLLKVIGIQKNILHVHELINNSTKSDRDKIYIKIKLTLLKKI